MTIEALRTRAAEAGEAGHHVVAGAQRRDVAADGLDDAGTLVSEDDRAIERPASHPVDDVQIAVAHAGGGGAHEHLAAPRLVDLDRLDRQRRVGLAKDGGVHVHDALLTAAGSSRSSRTR